MKSQIAVRAGRTAGATLLGLLALAVTAAGPTAPIVDLGSEPMLIAQATGGLQLDIPGDALRFRDGPFGPLLDWTELAPGRDFIVDLGVTNADAPSSRLELRASDVLGLDTTCAPPEAPVDTTCGVGRGELGDDLRFEVRGDSDNDADVTEFGAPLFEGTIDDLADGITLGDDLSSGEKWFFRITARLLPGDGNRTMTDSLAFSLQWSITGDTEVIPGAELRTPPAPISGVGTDTLGLRLATPPLDAPAVAGEAKPASRGLLPFTGAAGIREATVIALTLFLAGLAIRGFGARRARLRSPLPRSPANHRVDVRR
jgi:hypothetical protein